MRILAAVTLAFMQMTVLPFAAALLNGGDAHHPRQQADAWRNVTVIYKQE